MRIISNSNAIKPLSTAYTSDNDVNFIKRVNAMEEGFYLYSENYLHSCLDNKINNYSSLYLTNHIKFGEIITLNQIQNDPISSFTTSLAVLSSDKYITAIPRSDNSSILDLSVTSKSNLLIDGSRRIFEINLIDDTLCCIRHHYNSVDYYLRYSPSNVYFYNEYDETDSVFYYILDKKLQKISIFKNYFNVLKILDIDSKNNLNFIDSPSAFQTKNFDVNYYIQEIKPRLDTSWVSYNPRHKNSYSIVPEKSIYGIPNNYLVSTQYSYITGDTINANVLMLKNQMSNTNYSYRGDNLRKTNFEEPSVNFRFYNKIFSGNEQELGNYNLDLNYEFYNMDYLLKSDSYTTIKTPKDIYPYKKININDLKWNKSGSIAGDNPYMADRIFFNKQGLSFGSTYICTWLYKDKDGNCIWLDRYYNPEKSSYAKALQSAFDKKYDDEITKILNTKLAYTEYYDVPDVYNSLEEEYQHTPQTVRDALYGIPIFDKISDFIFEADREYIYYRAGKESIKNVLSIISDSLIENGLNVNTLQGTTIQIQGDVDTYTYYFNGSSYAYIDNYNKVNESNDHSFTMSLFLRSDDWTKKFGYQIFGNLTDKGISLISDPKITPLITVQNGNKVFVYNTDFNLIDESVLSLSATGSYNFIVKDLYRTDHLDSYYAITNYIE